MGHDPPEPRRLSVSAAIPARRGSGPPTGGPFRTSMSSCSLPGVRDLRRWIPRRRIDSPSSLPPDGEVPLGERIQLDPIGCWEPTDCSTSFPCSPPPGPPPLSRSPLLALVLSGF